MRDVKLRDYHLGKLPETEAGALEDRMLEDEDLFFRARTEYNDLSDEFARNELDAETRGAFVKRYGQNPKRAVFAKALGERVPRANVVPFVRKPQFWFAVAAALVAVIATFALRTTRRAPLQIPKGGETLIMTTATITLGTSRDGDTRTAITIPINSMMLHLRVRLDPEDRFDRYTLSVTNAKGEVVSAQENLQARGDNGDLIIEAEMKPLMDGTYRVAVQGDTTTLGFATLEVHR
jgi:hypothetical protein